MAAPTKSRPGYTDTHGAAEYTGFTYRTLVDWRWRGKGPRFERIGRSIRYRWSALDDFMHGKEG